MHGHHGRHEGPPLLAHSAPHLGRRDRLDRHGRQSLKAKHLAKSPLIAVSYWDPQHDTVIAQCRTEWCDDDATKRQIWKLLKSTPPPVGYDPGLFFKRGPDAPDYGVLKLTPLRVELWAGQDMLQGRPPTVWKG